MYEVLDVQEVLRIMMLNYIKKIVKKLDIIIDSKNFYIRISMDDFLYEANLISSSTNRKSLKKLYDIINDTLNMMRKIIKSIEESYINN